MKPFPFRNSDFPGLTDDIEEHGLDGGGRAVEVDPAAVDAAVDRGHVVQDEAGGVLVAAEEGAASQDVLVAPVSCVQVRLPSRVITANQNSGLISMYVRLREKGSDFPHRFAERSTKRETIG